MLNARATRQRMLRNLKPFIRQSSDPVERWKSVALRRVVDVRGAAAEPRIEIRWSVGFVLMGLLAGLPFGGGGPVFALLGLGLLVLVDALPGARLSQTWGRSSWMVIGAGGASIETFGRRLDRVQALLSGVIGPLVNLALGALSYVLSRRLHTPAADYVRTLALWQVVWGAAQALPIAPFRAGAALAAGLRSSRRAVLIGFSVKLLFLGGLVVSKLLPAAFPLVTLAVAGAVREFVRIYQVSADEQRGLPAEATRAELHVAAGEGARALAVARRALARARSESLRARLWRAFAWAAIGEGDPLLSHGALGALPLDALDVHLVASYLTTCNRLDEAAGLLEKARSLGQRTPETTRLLLDVSWRLGDLTRGRAVAREDAALLSDDDERVLRASLLTGPDAPDPVLRPHSSVDGDCSR